MYKHNTTLYKLCGGGLEEKKKNSNEEGRCAPPLPLQVTIRNSYRVGTVSPSSYHNEGLSSFPFPPSPSGEDLVPSSIDLLYPRHLHRSIRNSKLYPLPSMPARLGRATAGMPSRPLLRPSWPWVWGALLSPLWLSISSNLLSLPSSSGFKNHICLHDASYRPNAIGWITHPENLNLRSAPVANQPQYTCEQLLNPFYANDQSQWSAFQYTGLQASELAGTNQSRWEQWNCPEIRNPRPGEFADPPSEEETAIRMIAALSSASYTHFRLDFRPQPDGSLYYDQVGGCCSDGLSLCHRPNAFRDQAPTPGQFADGSTLLSALNPSSLFLGDVDTDGDLDLMIMAKSFVTGNEEAPDIYVSNNPGNSGQEGVWVSSSVTSHTGYTTGSDVPHAVSH